MYKKKHKQENSLDEDEYEFLNIGNRGNYGIAPKENLVQFTNMYQSPKGTTEVSRSNESSSYEYVYEEEEDGEDEREGTSGNEEEAEAEIHFDSVYTPWKNFYRF